MDNAPYHNTLSEHSPPMPLCSKKKIMGWLEQNKIHCRDDCLKPELVEILKKLAPEPLYAISEIARSHGHEVIRTPPYHPELQPIETCWGVVKNHVTRNCNFTMNNLIEQLDSGFLKPCAKQKYIRLKFTASRVLWEHMLVRAFKSWIKKATSLQRIHASISERGRVDANVCFGSTGRSK
jgi:hypothetical protein